MKVALAQFIYESNTFNPTEADLDFFTQHGTWLTDPVAIREWSRQSESQLEGSLTILADHSHETVPAFVAMCGTPGGRLSSDCYRTIRETFRDCLCSALPADALLLHLHGAVCAVGVDDVEGELLAMIRGELGFTGRIVVSLDLHANVTRRMLQHADAITGYRTFPHMDFRETGERAARLLLEHTGPTTRSLAAISALIPPTATDHRHGNFAAILAQARELETAADILDISLFPVQPWLDLDGLATSVVVTSTNTESGSRATRQLAEAWYGQRDSWDTGLLDWESIITRLSQPTTHPWLLVDTADATTGGSDGTSVEAIEELWPHRESLPGEVYLWVVDPEAVSEATTQLALKPGVDKPRPYNAPSRGVPCARPFRLGASQFSVEAEIIFSGESRFRPRGLAYTGQEFSCGRAIVLAAGQLRIVVTEQGCLCADPAFYECLGLPPAQALAVQVKSHMGWQAGYEVGPERGLRFDGPGCTTLNFARLPFSGERRELFPFNPSPQNPISTWQSI